MRKRLCLAWSFISSKRFVSCSPRRAKASKSSGITPTKYTVRQPCGNFSKSGTTPAQKIDPRLLKPWITPITMPRRWAGNSSAAITMLVAHSAIRKMRAMSCRTAKLITSGAKPVAKVKRV